MRSSISGALAAALLIAPAAALAQQPPAPTPVPQASPAPPVAQSNSPPQAQTTPSPPAPAAPAPTPSPADAVGPTGPGVADIPAVIVTEPPKPAKKAAAVKPRARPNISKSDASEGGPKAAPAQPAATTSISPEQAAQTAVATRTQSFDAARTTLSPPAAAAVTTFSREAISAGPQGDNAPVDKVLLRAPGVTQDSAASGDLHVRNEHGNLQYRLNGILLPEGVGGFGQFLDTGFIGQLSLLTGALPAQYGLRTAGVIDVQTQSGGITPGGTIGLYTGSHNTWQPSFDVGGQSGSTQYFFASRGNWNELGIENPTSRANALHDQTEQGKA